MRYRDLIAGPNVCICDECIELCNETIRGSGGKERGPIKGDPCEVEKETIDPFVGTWLLESTASEGQIAEGKKILVFTEFGRMISKIHSYSPGSFDKYYSFRATKESLILTSLNPESEVAWQVQWTNSGRLVLGTGEERETYVREEDA